MLDKNEHLRMSKVNEAIEEFPVPFIKIIRDPLINPLNLTERTTQSNHSTTELLTTPPTGRLHRHQPCTSPALVAISLRASSSCSGRTCVQKRPQEEEPPPNDAFDRSDPRHPHPSPCPSIRKGAPFGAQTRGGEKRPVWVWVNAAANLIGGILDRSMYI